MSYYKVLTKDIQDTNRVAVRKYDKSGQILEESFYSSYSKHKREGKQKTWFKSGAFKSEENYEKGKMSGFVLTYWENGQTKRKDYFKKGRFKKGECFDQNGNLILHFDYEVMPEFPGGMSEFYTYLRDNMGYPIDSYNKKIGGKVYVKFIVRKDGSITNARIVKGINQELDWEALRIIKYMPYWIPGKRDGELVDVNFRIPISFNI
jgi:TonB family protein